jgi:transcription elongation GreA/GreB family factor
VKKSEVIQACKELLVQKQETTQRAIASVEDSLKNDSKSSMGDKFETSREMAQGELDKLKSVWATIRKQMDLIGRVDPNPNADVGFGSMVTLETGTFFLALPIGKVQVGSEQIMSISAASPIGLALKGKKAGESITFNGKTITIKSIQ